jgi:hypothetical protein
LAAGLRDDRQPGKVQHDYSHNTCKGSTCAAFRVGIRVAQIPITRAIAMPAKQFSLRRCPRSRCCVLNEVCLPSRANYCPYFSFLHSPAAKSLRDRRASQVLRHSFQAREFGTPESGGVERRQQSAMQGRASRIDESRDFFVAEDRWQVNGLLRVGRSVMLQAFLSVLT